MSALSLVIVVSVLALQTLGGATWWWLLRRGRVTSAAELVGMGLALGTITSTVSAIVLKPTPLSSTAWALPAIAALLVALVVLCRKGRQIRPSSLDCQTHGELRALVLGVVVGMVPIWINWRRIPLGNATDSSFLDLYFLQALSNGLARFGGGESILMTGGSLRYHWLSYAWIGEIDQTAGLPVFAGLTRVLPIVALIGVSALAARWSAVLARGSRFAGWVPAVAVLLVVAGGYTGALYGSILNFDSPSQTLTTLWLLGLLITVVFYLQDGRRWLLAAVAVLAAASTGGKVSHIAVAAGGLLLLSIIGLLTRQGWRWRAVVALVVSGISALFTYVLLIRGAAIDRNLVEDVAVKASTWQGLDPLPGTWGILAGTIALVLAALARVLGIAWLARERRWRTDPSALLALGGLSVGFVALLALRDGINETWFLLAASAPAAIVSAVGAISALAYVSERLGPPGIRRALLLAIATAIPALILSMNIFSDEVRPFAHWLATWMPWLVAAIGALFLTSRGSDGSRLSLAIALAIFALVASSVLTRPSVWWTSQRQVFTETADVIPEAFAPGSTDNSSASGGSIGLSRVHVAAELRALAAPKDVVFTNAPYSSFVPAYTGLRMYLAGERYQFGLGAAGDVGELRDRQSGISQVAADSTAASTLLCPDDVDWLWWEGDVPEVFRDLVRIAGAEVSVIDFRDVCDALSTS